MYGFSFSSPPAIARAPSSTKTKTNVEKIFEALDTKIDIYPPVNKVIVARNFNSANTKRLLYDFLDIYTPEFKKNIDAQNNIFSNSLIEHEYDSSNKFYIDFSSSGIFEQVPDSINNNQGENIEGFKQVIQTLCDSVPIKLDVRGIFSGVTNSSKIQEKILCKMRLAAMILNKDSGTAFDKALDLSYHKFVIKAEDNDRDKLYSPPNLAPRIVCWGTGSCKTIDDKLYTTEFNFKVTRFDTSSSPIYVVSVSSSISGTLITLLPLPDYFIKNILPNGRNNYLASPEHCIGFSRNGTYNVKFVITQAQYKEVFEGKVNTAFEFRLTGGNTFDVNNAAGVDPTNPFPGVSWFASNSVGANTPSSAKIPSRTTTEPKVTTDNITDITDITDKSAKLTATIDNPSNVTITQMGFELFEKNPTTETETGTEYNTTNITGNIFTHTLTNLTPKKDYWIRAYIKYNDGSGDKKISDGTKKFKTTGTPPPAPDAQPEWEIQCTETTSGSGITYPKFVNKTTNVSQDGIPKGMTKSELNTLIDKAKKNYNIPTNFELSLYDDKLIFYNSTNDKDIDTCSEVLNPPSSAPRAPPAPARSTPVPAPPAPAVYSPRTSFTNTSPPNAPHILKSMETKNQQEELEERAKNLLSDLNEQQKAEATAAKRAEETRKRQEAAAAAAAAAATAQAAEVEKNRIEKAQQAEIDRQREEARIQAAAAAAKKEDRRIQALPKQLGAEIQLTDKQREEGLKALNTRLEARRSGTNNPEQASSIKFNLPSPSQTFVKELPEGWEPINNNGTYSYRNTIDNSIQSKFPSRPASEVANLRAQAAQPQAAPAQQPQKAQAAPAQQTQAAQPPKAQAKQAPVTFEQQLASRVAGRRFYLNPDFGKNDETAIEPKMKYVDGLGEYVNQRPIGVEEPTQYFEPNFAGGNKANKKHRPNNKNKNNNKKKKVSINKSKKSTFNKKTRKNKNNKNKE